MNQPGATPPANAFAAEIAGLRDRLRVIDEIDRRTSEMVERLAEAVRTSGEIRALATLEIAATVDRLERSLGERDARQREALALLQAEVAAAHARAVGVGVALGGIERELAGLEARFEAAGEATATGEEVVEPMPHAEPAAAAIRPLPSAASLFVEVEQVPTAGAALSIQRYVSELSGVVAATTREYAAGLLRLEVRTRGAFDPEQLLAWPGGTLELLAHEGDGLLLRLAS